MSDNPFDDGVIEPVEPEEEDPLADFMTSVEEDIADPATGVTIRTIAGGNTFVPLSEPTTVQDVLVRSRLPVSGQVEYWVNGTSVPGTESIAPGGTVTVVGVVKGG